MPVARLFSVRLLFDRGTTLLRDLDPGFDLRLSGGPLGSTRPVLPGRRIPLSGPSPRADSDGCAILDEVRIPQLPWAPVPIELRPYQRQRCGPGAGAAPRSRRPADGSANRLALERWHAPDRARCASSDTNPARAVLHHIKRALQVRRLLRRRHPRARCADRRTFESAYRHMDRLGTASISSWSTRRTTLAVACATRPRCRSQPPGWTHGRTPLARCRGPRRGSSNRWPTAYELTIGDLAGTFLSSFDIAPCIST